MGIRFKGADNTCSVKPHTPHVHAFSDCEKCHWHSLHAAPSRAIRALHFGHRRAQLSAVLCWGGEGGHSHLGPGLDEVAKHSVCDQETALLDLGRCLLGPVKTRWPHSPDPTGPSLSSGPSLLAGARREGGPPGAPQGGS